MALSLEGHTTRAFDGDLSSLHIQAVAMGALVIEQVQLAVSAYSNWTARLPRWYWSASARSTCTTRKSKRPHCR